MSGIARVAYFTKAGSSIESRVNTKAIRYAQMNGQGGTMAESTRLKYVIEWESAPSVRGDEHRATWARFELWVDDTCVTQLEDSNSGSARRSIYVSLYPLAEWITFNWWPLFYDYRSMWKLEKSRTRNPYRQRQAWSEIRSHTLRDAGDGFLWPDLAILPKDDAETFLVWHKDQTVPNNWTSRFISDGSTRVKTDEVIHFLSSIVEEVIGRLREQGITKSSLMDEWDRIRSCEDDERDFCVAAAQLGLDPYSEEAISLEERIIRISSTVTGDTLLDFLGVARPHSLDEEIDWILSAADESQRSSENTLPSISLPDSSESSLRSSPWRLGWHEASTLRRNLDLAPTQAIRLDNWVRTATKPTLNVKMQALGFASSSNIGSLVLGKSHVHKKTSRFVQARALWHLAHRPTGIFLVVESYGIRQKIERAFAAEFLAPAEGIKEMLSDPSAASLDEVERIADTFDVSAFVIQHQIENQLSGVVLE